MVKETKYYEVLGVKPDADADAIKRAYRKRAPSVHPDKFVDPAEKAEAEEKFKELGTAFAVLSDPEQRARYDRLGEAGLADGGGGGGGVDPSDIFASLFGFGGRRGAPGERKPREIIYELEVPLEDLYMGKIKKLRITRDRLCSACKGSGAKVAGASVACSDCKGRGVKVVLQQLMPGFVQQMQQVCPTCRGERTTMREEDKCGTCRGQRLMQEPKIFEVAIEKGMKSGDFKTFMGEGDQIPGASVSGDVVICIKEKPHSVFKRRGRALVVERTVSLADALCGFAFVLTHLDDRRVVVKATPGQVLKPLTPYVISREGMPVKGTGGTERGDLVVIFKVEFPRALSDSQQREIRRVLGVPAPAIPPASADHEYFETTLDECKTSIEQLAGKDDDDDDDDDRRGGGGGPGGGSAVRCAHG